MTKHTFNSTKIVTRGDNVIIEKSKQHCLSWGVKINLPVEYNKKPDLYKRPLRLTYYPMKHKKHKIRLIYYPRLPRIHKISNVGHKCHVKQSNTFVQGR